MNTDTVKKYIRIACISAAVVLVGCALCTDMVPGGTLTVAVPLQGSSAYFSDLHPTERVSVDRGAARFTGDPVYSDARLPRRFDSATAHIAFTNDGGRECLFGVRTGSSEAPTYTLRAYSAPVLPQDWDQIREGDMVLYQKTNTYSSIEDFSSHHPMDTSVGTFRMGFGVVPADARAGIIDLAVSQQPQTVYTTAPLVKVTAFKAAGLGVVTVGSASIRIAEIQKPYWRMLPPSEHKIVTAHGGVQIAGPGLFSTNPGILTHEGPIALEGRTELPATVSYVLARVPELGAGSTTLTVPLDDAAYHGTSAQFVFSQPYAEVGPGCAVSALSLTFTRPSLQMATIGTFLHDYVRDTYYAIRNR